MHALVTQSILEVRQGRRDEGYPYVLVRTHAGPRPKCFPNGWPPVTGRLPEGPRKVPRRLHAILCPGGHVGNIWVPQVAPSNGHAQRVKLEPTTGVTRLRNWSGTGLRDRSSSHRNWTQKLGSVTECQKRRVREGPRRFPEAFLEGQ